MLPMADGDGIEHPMIASAKQRPVRRKICLIGGRNRLVCLLALDLVQAPGLAAVRFIDRTIPHLLAQVRIRTPNHLELDLGVNEKARSAVNLPRPTCIVHDY